MVVILFVPSPARACNPRWTCASRAGGCGDHRLLGLRSRRSGEAWSKRRLVRPGSSLAVFRLRGAVRTAWKERRSGVLVTSQLRVALMMNSPPLSPLNASDCRDGPLPTAGWPLYWRTSPFGEGACPLLWGLPGPPTGALADRVPLSEGQRARLLPQCPDGERNCHLGLVLGIVGPQGGT